MTESGVTGDGGNRSIGDKREVHVGAGKNEG